MQQSIKFLSVVVPVYNEEQAIGHFYELLKKELESLKIDSHEIIFVDDGSNDKSVEKLSQIAQGDKNVFIIELTRNFGKEAALSAGLHNVKGDAVLILDADGQHPPSKIHELIDAYKSGYEMVAGLRTVNPDEGLFKKVGNKLYYKLAKIAGASYLLPRVTDFRVMSRHVVDNFCVLSERRRITRGLLDWMGYPTKYVEFDSPERLAGSASYSTRKLITLAIDSILANSRKPLYVSIMAGCFITLASGLALISIFIENYLMNDPYNLQVTGTGMLGLFILFMVGLIFISQGILALYLARIYEEAQQRPLYIIMRPKSKLEGFKIKR